MFGASPAARARWAANHAPRKRSPLPVALELGSHSVRRACARAMAARPPAQRLVSPDRLITMRSPVAASLASILTRRQPRWRPHGVGAAGGWHARAVRGCAGIHVKDQHVDRRERSRRRATPGLLGGGRGSGGEAAARAAANAFDHLAGAQRYVPLLLTQKQIQNGQRWTWRL